MEYTTKFVDFEPQQLVGKYVLFEHGQTYVKNTFKIVGKIIKVTKTGFKIDVKNFEDRLFDFDGHQKGLRGRQNWSTISQCVLLTDWEAQQWFEQCKALNELKHLREQVLAAVPNLEKGKLLLIKKIIELNTKDLNKGIDTKA